MDVEPIAFFPAENRPLRFVVVGIPRMDAGRGSYLCGLVLGVAVGVAGTHVALSGRAQSVRRLPELKVESGIASSEAPGIEALAPELQTAFAPQPSTVHAIATSPVDVEPAEGTAAEPPRPLPNIADAEPLPAALPREDSELRAFIRDELQTLAASEHDIWYETLRGLSREDATEILRIWKLTRGAGLGPSWPALQHTASLPVEKVSTEPASERPSAPAAKTQAIQATVNEELRRLCQLNLANAATPGFKRRELMIFEQSGTRASEESQAMAQGVWINVAQGKVTATKRLLDCAIQGAGFFQVQREGGTFLTRCGRFVLDDQRRLALPRSHGPPCPLEPAIVVPSDCERLQIQPTGQVVAVTKDDASKNLGTIKLFGVLDPAALKAVGDNLFEASSASGPAAVLSPSERGQVIQGSIEESNVDPAAERRKLDALAVQNTAI